MFRSKQAIKTLSIATILLSTLLFFRYLYNGALTYSASRYAVVGRIDTDPIIVYEKPQIKVLGKSTVDTESVSDLQKAEIEKILAMNEKLAKMAAEPDPDTVLILTPLKDAARFLDKYFSLVDGLEYPRDKLSIAFIVSDSTDNTQQILLEKQKWYQETGPKKMRFNRFEIYRQDFYYILSRGERHKFEKQQERRTMMARARNYLWTRALKDEQWVIWTDADLVHYPPSIINDLKAYDKDIIVPACMFNATKPGGPLRYGLYDYNNWQETDASRKMLATLDDSAFLAEDLKYIKTGRRYLSKIKGQEIVPLDGIGGTFVLVKSHVHRSGVSFPTWLVDHQVETEGFAKLAKANGFGVYGLPSYHVLHKY